MSKKSKITKQIKSILTVSALTLGTIISTVSFPAVSASAEIDYNYAKALQYSMYFYDANMCGTDVGENSEYSWRDDCHCQDATLPLDTKYTNMSANFINSNKKFLDPDGNGTVDVSGGYHDAGDHVKFGVPEAYAASTVGWGYYEFRESYEKTNQDDHAETILRYFNDYFMRCTFLDDKGDVVAFCYQVGDGVIDHDTWSAPELQGDMFRPARFASSEDPATDCVTNSAGSLAINYLNFKDTDPEYANKCLKYAKALFKFAEESSSKAISEDGPGSFYTSSKWEDDYCWGAIWLYLATNDMHYRTEALKNLDYYAAPTYVHCWNDMWGGVMCAVAEANDKDGGFEDEYKSLTGKSPYEDIDFWGCVAETNDVWMTKYNTPGGYAFLNKWGSARYNTAAQFVALVYDKHNGGASKYSQWAEGQMQYIMGDNPINRCYIVGYNDLSVEYPHHRASSGLTMAEDTRKQRYVLYGALVGGPDGEDKHTDTTNDWIYNEVTIDYNAAFVGACAGLYHFFGNDSMEVTPDFPPQVVEEDTPTKYWVEGYVADDASVSALTFFVYGTAPKADKNISVRYYFDTKGMNLFPNEMVISQYYDQVQMETDYKAVLGTPKQYKDSIYYIEVSWPDYAIANSNKKYQFAIGSYNGNNKWDPSDDWSHQGMTTSSSSATGTCTEAPNFCVYSNGVLVGGIEPDGTTPDAGTSEPEYKLNDLMTMLSHILGKSEIAKNDFDKYDANNDSKIDSVDMAIVKRMILSK